MSMNIYGAIGWHSPKTLAREVPGSDISASVHNGLIISGYVPVLAIFSGGLKVRCAIQENGYSLLFRIYAAVRGILEIIGLGILFLIPDLIVSLHRHVFCAQTEGGNEAPKYIE